MSICVYGRINKKCIDADLLERTIIDFFSPKGNIVKKINNECMVYENISDSNEIIISFVSEKKSPYNIYDSSIINDEFEYIQLLVFDIAKKKYLLINMRKLLIFVFI